MKRFSRYPSEIYGLMLAIVLSLWLLGGQVVAQDQPLPDPPVLTARSYVLMDATTGYIVAQLRPNYRVAPASLTKIMTSFIIADLIARGQLADSDEVLVSERAWAQKFRNTSRMFLDVGDIVSVGDLHKGIIVSSGNDASVAIAEHISGSEDAFVQLMNTYAKSLKLKNSYFSNAHGLPAIGDHYTSAMDMVLLTRAYIERFPEPYKLYKQRFFKYSGINQRNRNDLLAIDPTVDGVKTGYTSEAGYCLVSSAKRGDMRLISAVMGSSSNDARIQDTRKLLLYGFRYFASQVVNKPGDALVTEKVWGSSGQQGTLTVAEPVAVTLPRGANFERQVTLNDGRLKAPLEVGKPYGKVTYQYNNETLVSAPLVALTDIAKGSIWYRLRDFTETMVRQLLGI